MRSKSWIKYFIGDTVFFMCITPGVISYLVVPLLVMLSIVPLNKVVTARTFHCKVMFFPLGLVN